MDQRLLLYFAEASEGFSAPALEVVLLAILPVLLLLSACLSASETALFGMNESEREQIRRGGTIPARAVELLLVDRRMLLITILLGNMTVNVLYFVISSVLMMRNPWGVAGEVVLGMASLIGLVLLGEVLPKMIASARRVTVSKLVGPPLLGLHQTIGPLRGLISSLIVKPLSALTAPRDAPPRLGVEELQALLTISSSQGVIDADEQRILRDVLGMRRLRVRDVMIPRVRMFAVPITATADNVRQVARTARLTKLPVYDGDLDHILGLLPVKSFLLDATAPIGASRTSILPAQYVPMVASLDQLMEHFRKTGTQLAIVVDEFGGTAGVVAVEDVVETLVGDIAAVHERLAKPPRMIGHNRWQVDGDISVHDWAEAFGQQLVSPRVATVGGLIVDRLGRAAEVGDIVQLGNVRLEVEEVARARVVSAIITLLDDADAREGTTP
jgi:CBS domain containing-hemolysin-like protein